MNESPDTEPVETLLDRIRPVEPSADLMLRLLSAKPAFIMTPPPPEAKVIAFRPWLTSVAAVLAVAGCAALFFQPKEAAPVVAAVPPVAEEPPVPALQFLAPQRSHQELLGVRNIGFARDEQSRPVRLMHATWLDDDVYSRGDGSPPVREARVRDEILPVVLTTY